MELTCRICYGDGEEGELVSPCACRGTIERVHISCLEKYISVSRRDNCATCGTKYSIDIDDTINYYKLIMACINKGMTKTGPFFGLATLLSQITNFCFYNGHTDDIFVVFIDSFSWVTNLLIFGTIIDMYINGIGFDRVYIFLMGIISKCTVPALFGAMAVFMVVVDDVDVILNEPSLYTVKLKKTK